MAFALKPGYRALLQAFGSTVALSLLLQPAIAQEAEKTEKILVTGSSIKRTEVEGPAPVQVVSKKEIERTGATTVNELLRSLPTVDFFDQGELASNSPSGSGTANVTMRGLSENNVLVLLNGRRLPKNAMADGSGAGDAVDVNMIPISAIERVEVLKDGGSAVYGADAVAGVVNFITKRDFQGLEMTAGGGTSSRGDATEYSAGLSGGFGNYDENRFNITMAVDYFHREPIYRKDREISRSVDFRRYGGPDRRSSFSPAGNIVDDNGLFTGEIVGTCPPEDLSGTRCRYDFNKSLLTSYNGAERVNAMLLGQFKISESVRLSAELMGGYATNSFDAHPVPDYFLLPDGRYYAGRFMQGGPRHTDKESQLLQAGFGFDGNVGKYDWDLHYTYGLSKTTNKESNYYDQDLWNAATSAGLIDATRTDNDPALVESLKVTPQRDAKYQQHTIDAKFSGELFKFSGGTVGFAVGAQWVKEKLSDIPDELTQQGLVVGSIQQSAVNASRDASALYTEFSIPFGKMFESQLALRYDKGENESKVSPKFAFLVRPLDSLMLRASYAESFRAPSLKQLYGGQEEGAVNIDLEAWCQQQGISPCDVPAYSIGGSNPNLKAETGKTLNFGFVFEPIKGMSAGVDYFQIKKSDNVDVKNFDKALMDGDWFFSNGRYYVLQLNENIAKTTVSGLDFDVRYRMPFAGGAFSIGNNATRYLENKRQPGEGAEWEDENGNYAAPKWRNTFTAMMEFPAWTVSSAIRTTGGFSDSDAPLPHPDGTRKVGAYEEVDLSVIYSGIKSLQVTAGVKNLFDRQPPYSEQNVSSNDYTQMGFAENYSNRGSFMYFNVDYKFF